MCLNRPPMKDAYSVLVRKYVPSGEYHLEPEWIEHRMSTKCRTYGSYENGQWQDYEECRGCTAEKDEEFIARSREDYEAEMLTKRVFRQVRSESSGGV